MTKQDKYTSAEYQHAVKDFVQREVVYCVSYLISELAKDEKHMDDLLPVLQQSDWIAPAQEHGAKLHYREDDGHWCVLDQNDNDMWHMLFGTQEEAAQMYCEENDLEPHTIEAYEHWIVSDWLMEKLDAKGEMVTDFMNLNIWGRACTGQAIALDRVICDIYDELHAGETKNKQRAATLDALITVKP